MLRLAALSPALALGDPGANAGLVFKALKAASEKGVQLAVLPELALTGATCGDLFRQPDFWRAAEAALKELLAATAELPLAFAAGLPFAAGGRLYSGAALACRGRLLGLVPDTCPDQRYFSLPGGPLTVSLAGQEAPCAPDLVFRFTGGACALGFTGELFDYRQPLAQRAALGEALLVLGAFPEGAGRERYLLDTLKVQSSLWRAGLAFAGAGAGESTGEAVYGGQTLLFEAGRPVEMKAGFAWEGCAIGDLDLDYLVRERSRRPAAAGSRSIDLDLPPLAETGRLFPPAPFVPLDPGRRAERCREIFGLQCRGLARRLRASRSRCAVVGVSGGLDSTLTLLVAREAVQLAGLPPEAVVGVTMPCFGTTSRTRGNAWRLMEQLGLKPLEIPIEKAVRQHFADIGQEEGRQDAAFENSQARERTQVLMDLANRLGGIVAGTGDLSEAALGWATYNGDHMSMYNVNCGVAKTLVRALVEWRAAQLGEPAAGTLRDILATPISPELLPSSGGDSDQKTEDLVGPYELHDFFLYHFLRRGSGRALILSLAENAFAGRYSREVLEHWLSVFFRRFLTQQFKRSCSPEGPAAGSLSLSPRGALNLPSDASFKF